MIVYIHVLARCNCVCKWKAHNGASVVIFLPIGARAVCWDGAVMLRRMAGGGGVEGDGVSRKVPKRMKELVL